MTIPITAFVVVLVVAFLFGVVAGAGVMYQQRLLFVAGIFVVCFAFVVALCAVAWIVA